MTYSTVGPIQWMVLFELFLCALAVLLAAVLPGWGRDLFEKSGRGLKSIAANRNASLLVAALLPITIRGLILPIFPPPPPLIADDYSYLFLGDTFASGRLANPSPRGAEHFETNFIFTKPTFSSQYQPAQGLIIALGKILTGQPWFGILLSSGIFFGVLCWALQGVVPPDWALFGTAICAVQFGIFGIFVNTYRGAAAAAIGGALVFGCLARLRESAKTRYGVLAGAGIVVMLASRPAEAIIWTVLTIGYTWVIRQRISGPKLVLSFGFTLTAGLALLSWYNMRVTGSFVDLPYAHYQKLYGTPQGFWWQKPVPHPSTKLFPNLQQEYEHQLRLQTEGKTLRGVMQATLGKVTRAWQFFLGPILTVPFLFSTNLLRAAKNRLWLLAALPFGLDHLTFHTWYPNQSAPEYVFFAFIATQCWRYMRCLTLGQARIGRPLSRWLALAGITTLLLPIIGKTTEPILPKSLRHARAVWFCEFIDQDPRGDIIKFLRAKPGKHLVFVEWSRVAGSRFDGWLYNEPDLDAADLVWARSINLQSDRELSLNYPGRQTWKVKGKKFPAVIHPYKLP